MRIVDRSDQVVGVRIMSDRKNGEHSPPEAHAAGGEDHSSARLGGLDRRSLLRIAAATAGLAAMGNALGGAKKTKVDTPAIGCGGAGNDYIDIHVCAGAGGAPAGFSIQWMTCDDYARHELLNPDGTGTGVFVENTWFDSNDPRLCKASFSGNANLSRYNLTASDGCGNGGKDEVTIRVGEILLDSGASTNCPDALVACTCYVFRAFAHATNNLNRSDFTANLQCVTTGCGGGCDPFVKSFGFWKTHYPDAWPADVLASGMTVGCQYYTAAQLESILLQSPAGGNELVALAHQVINTRFNYLNGASQAYQDATAADLAAADALMCTTGPVPPVGSGYLSGAQAGGLTYALDAERGQFECAE
jgi:hypothetical protein